jgi:hypothetical protein
VQEGRFSFVLAVRAYWHMSSATLLSEWGSGTVSKFHVQICRRLAGCAVWWRWLQQTGCVMTCQPLALLGRACSRINSTSADGFCWNFILTSLIWLCQNLDFPSALQTVILKWLSHELLRWELYWRHTTRDPESMYGNSKNINKTKQTLWSESASELYQPSDRRFWRS